MIAPQRKLATTIVCAGILLLLWAAECKAQQPEQPSKPNSPTASAQSVTSIDPVTEIDELLTHVSDQMTHGHLKEAGETAQQALELSKKSGDNTRAVRSLLLMGRAYYLQVRLTEGLDLAQQSLELARQLGDKSLVAQALNLKASILRVLGRYEEALDYFDQSAALAREINDLPMQWTVSRNIGVLYNEMGDSDKAEAPLREALRIAYELKAPQWSNQVKDGGKFARESSLETMGLWEAGREHYTAAIKYLDEAMADKPEHPVLTAELFVNLAFCREKLGESQKAADLLREAIKVWESSGNPPHPAMVVSLAASEESLGHLQEAYTGLQRGLALVRESGGNAQYEWLIEGRLARVEREMRRTEESLAQYEEAIHSIEILRASALNTESGRAFALSTRRAVYAEAADLLYELHREPEALEMAERGHARAFLDMLALLRSGIPDDLTPEQHEREDAKLARISEIQKGLWKESISPDEEKAIKARLTSAEDDLEAFRLELRRANPRYASIRYPEPITVPEIQNKLLDDNTALVEYLLGEKRSLVWVVTNKKLVTAVLPARKEIEEQVAAYSKLLRTRASALTEQKALGEIRGLGTRLYTVLIGPVEPALASKPKLIIVPDGALNYLPFEALVATSSLQASAGKKPLYLLDNHSVVYGPSASALVTIQVLNHDAAAPSKMLLAFGDPETTAFSTATAGGAVSMVGRPGALTRQAAVVDDYSERGFTLSRLPYTRAEILAISKLFQISQRHIYLGADAREETVKSEKLDDFRYIHFASHGFLDESKPGRSGILFSRTPVSAESGVLRVDEIMRMKMNADLVTLSACSTGLGKLVNGEGILGLTRAFFYAGARNLTVSLWNVNDSATATLMAAFYRNLKHDVPKSLALREAKLALLHSEDLVLRHPYFWSAFVLVGEGK